MSIISKDKKLVSVLATFALMIIANKKIIPIVIPSFEVLNSHYFPLLLKCILYIYLSIQFKINQAKVQALLNFGSKINIITLAYAASLYLKIWSSSVGAKKINSSIFEILKMILANF